ncbi:hypothetical protein Tco_0082759, partial [Tanacetum coccineum]
MMRPSKIHKFCDATLRRTLKGLKKLEKSHDPLALVAHMGSSSRNTSSYYVTHPSSVVDYDEEYEQDDVHNHFEDPLASAMLLLAKAITQNFSNPTNNRLRASSNTRITPDTPSRISTTTTTMIPNPARQGMGEVKCRQVISLPLTGKETASGKTS